MIPKRCVRGFCESSRIWQKIGFRRFKGFGFQEYVGMMNLGPYTLDGCAVLMGLGFWLRGTELSVTQTNRVCSV